MSAESDIAIDVRGLTKSFGAKKVVDNFTLQVARGHIQGFLGPNGSGKTTTIRMLCGLLTPDSGEGECLGYDIRRQQEEIKRYVGYMTQGFSLYRDLTIRENLEFVARVYGLEAPEDAAQGGARAPAASSRAPTSSPANCPAAGSSDWRLAPASCLARRCSSSTNRPRASIPRRDATSGTRSIIWRRKA